jgi:hypothetical protein
MKEKAANFFFFNLLVICQKKFSHASIKKLPLINFSTKLIFKVQTKIKKVQQLAWKAFKNLFSCFCGFVCEKSFLKRFIRYQADQHFACFIKSSDFTLLTLVFIFHHEI